MSAAKRKNPFKLPKFKYKEQFGVIVICKTEAEQKRTYNKLRKLKLNLRVVTV